MSEENNKILSLVNLGQGKLLGELYGDIAKPGIQKVGHALGTILDLSNTFLLPIKLLNENTKAIFLKNIANYQKKLEKIPDDKICEVPPQIGIPIIDKLTYISNEEIRNSFINLLTKASNIDTINTAHPGFVNLIDRISPDEARIIKYLKGKEFIPFLSVQVHYVKEQGYCTHCKQLTGIERDVKLDFPQNINLYLDNLLSIGVIYHTQFVTKTDKSYYENIKSSYTDKISDLNQKFLDREQYRELEFEEGFFEITDFGKLFIVACTD